MSPAGRSLRRRAGARWQILADLLRLMTPRDRRRTVVVTVLSLSVAAATAANGLSRRWLVESALHGSATGLAAAVAVGAAAYTLTAACGRIESNMRLYLIERFGIMLNRQIVAWSAGIPTLEQLDDPRFLDRSSLLRNSTIHLAGGLSAITEAVAAAGGILLSAWLLADIYPALGLLVILAFLPVFANSWGQRAVRDARERSVGWIRLEQRLHELIVRPEPAKEALVAGTHSMLGARASGLWRDAWRTESRANLVAAGWQLLGWTAYVGGLLTALVIVSRLVSDRASSLGDAVLVLSLSTQLLIQINTAIQAAQRVSLAGHVVEYYQSLREVAHRPHPGHRQAPAVLRHGITLRDVSFGYGSSRDGALRHLDVHLPAAATVAVVGVNGAGKSTLVKLLAGMYEPKAGRIEIDGVPLHELDPASWRSRLSAAFQDAIQFQLRADEAVRIGDLRQRDQRAVAAAARRAGAAEIIEQLPDGYQTQLGTQFGGVDLSGGQWQRVALARACMRQDPLLLLLDEPTAAIDPASEHQLFERFTRLAADSARRSGTITLLVTHRYSTVRSADLIIVLDGGRIIERGHHDELMALGGRYAELYGLQAKGYL